MPIQLEGQVALVTGSSRGIGFEIARVLSEHGATVVCCGTKLESAQAAAAKISEETGNTTMGLQVNVADSEDVNRLVKDVLTAYGRLDILVNNAGITRDNLLIRLSDTEWTDVVQTNLNSVFFATKAVLRPMMKQKHGRIINVASVVGLMGNAGQANYAAAKAGIMGFAKSVAREYGVKGITCNVVAPGFIDTDMIASLPKEYLDNIIKSIPQQRLGTPKDVANLVLFLSSDLSAYVTGEVIRVDGGMRM